MLILNRLREGIRIKDISTYRGKNLILNGEYSEEQILKDLENLSNFKEDLIKTPLRVLRMHKDFRKAYNKRNRNIYKAKFKGDFIEG